MRSNTPVMTLEEIEQWRDPRNISRALAGAIGAHGGWGPGEMQRLADSPGPDERDSIIRAAWVLADADTSSRHWADTSTLRVMSWGGEVVRR